jgi:hypothetical protein
LIFKIYDDELLRGGLSFGGGGEEGGDGGVLRVKEEMGAWEELKETEQSQRFMFSSLFNFARISMWC